MSMINAADPALLRYARALTCGSEHEIDAARRALWDRPGRAAGRVTAWSIDRALVQFRRHARRPVFCAVPDAPASPLECSFLDIVSCLAAGRRAEAEMRANFLITPQGRDAFLSALAPAASSLAAAA